MGTLTTSCCICGGWIKREFVKGNTNTTKWGTCVKCRNKENRVGGDMRMEGERKRLRRVYVCAPFKGDIRGNTERAKNVAMKLATEAAHEGKELPFFFVPHLAFQYTVDGNTEMYREWAMRMCVEAVRMCDEIVVCGEVMTEGMQREVEEAGKRGVVTTHRRDLK